MLGTAFREPTSAGTHLIWLAFAVPGMIPLWRATGNDPLKRRAAMVFGGSLLFCSAGSFLYHAVPIEFTALFHLMDHVGIFLLIAGTVTPIGLIVLDGWWRRGLVGGIWLIAFVGISLRIHVSQSEGVLTALYLFMGWIGSLTYCELARRLSHRRMMLLWLGGLFYTLGAIINSTGRPILIPGLFQAHELFHVFVMAGSFCHYLFIVRVVLPHRLNGSGLPAMDRAAENSLRREKPGHRIDVVESYQ